MWRPWQSAERESQTLEHSQMDAIHFEIHASYHPEASNEPAAMDTEPHQSN